MTSIPDHKIRELAEATRQHPHLARANFLTARDIADQQIADLLAALKKCAEFAERASLVQDRSVQIIKDACRFVADEARAAIQKVEEL